MLKLKMQKCGKNIVSADSSDDRLIRLAVSAKSLKIKIIVKNNFWLKPKILN